MAQIAQCIFCVILNKCILGKNLILLVAYTTIKDLGVQKIQVLKDAIDLVAIKKGDTLRFRKEKIKH